MIIWISKWHTRENYTFFPHTVWNCTKLVAKLATQFSWYPFWSCADGRTIASTSRGLTDPVAGGRFQHYTCSPQPPDICLGKTEMARNPCTSWEHLGMSRRTFTDVDCGVGGLAVWQSQGLLFASRSVWGKMGGWFETGAFSLDSLTFKTLRFSPWDCWKTAGERRWDVSGP